MTQFNIDRAHVMAVFEQYTAAYDSKDEKVRLKIDHTYRVAQLCERLAQAEGLSEADTELVWLLGMLHDVGRFEQLRRYDTFIDAESIDHAMLGADILFGENTGDLGMCCDLNSEADKRQDERVDNSRRKIRDYVQDAREDGLIETAVRVHNRYRIPEELPERTEKLCHILRDADKIDILKVNVEVPLEEIYDTTREELKNAEVSEAVMKSFYEHKATLRGIRKTVVDHVVGHISLVYELVFPESLCIVKEQGYLDQLLHFESYNPKTCEQFAELREEMERYLAAAH